ncbi:hypothetical protein D3C77_291860 [compost metagenome]
MHRIPGNPSGLPLLDIVDQPLGERRQVPALELTFRQLSHHIFQLLLQGWVLRILVGLRAGRQEMAQCMAANLGVFPAWIFLRLRLQAPVLAEAGQQPIYVIAVQILQLFREGVNMIVPSQYDLLQPKILQCTAPYDGLHLHLSTLFHLKITANIRLAVENRLENSETFESV